MNDYSIKTYKIQVPIDLANICVSKNVDSFWQNTWLVLHVYVYIR